MTGGCKKAHAISEDSDQTAQIDGRPGALIKLKYIYSGLPLSRIPRDSLKRFEISVLRHIRVERVRKTVN